MSTDSVAGISLGNTFCVISIVKTGTPQIIANEDGDHSIPTCVAFSGSETLIGTQADAQVASNARNTLVDFFLLLNPSVARESLKDHRKQYRLVQDDVKGGAVSYELCLRDLDTGVERNTTIAVREVAKIYLRKLKESIEAYIGKSLTNVVLTIPNHFLPIQSDLEAICAEVGLPLSQICVDAVTAYLYYAECKGTASHKPDKKILAIDIGATVSSVSLLNAHEGVISLSASSHKYAGGNVFDDVLLAFFKDDFKKKTGSAIDNNAKSMLKIARSSEICKRVLSNNLSGNCFVESLFDGVDFSSPMQRSKFDLLTSSTVSKKIDFVKHSLENFRITLESIDEVLLLGGSCRIPKLQSKIASLFEHAQVLNTVDSAEVASLGAAHQALLSSKNADISVLDLKSIAVKCVTRAIAVSLDDSTENSVALIEAGTPFPFTREFNMAVAAESDVIAVRLVEVECAKGISVRPLVTLAAPAAHAEDLKSFKLVFDGALDGTIKATLGLTSGQEISCPLN